jgi:hypothetical protein
MKKLLLITTTLFLTTQVFSQDKDFTLSNVQSSSGKFVFYNKEPYDAYTKAFYFPNPLPDIETAPISEIYAACIKNAMKESGLQGGEPFDAVVVSDVDAVTDGKPRAKAIKFKEISAKNSLAKIGTVYLGVYIFDRTCIPVNEHDYIATVNVRWHKKDGQEEKAFLEIIERSKKKYPNFDGLIFKDEKSADLIKFRGLEKSGGGFRVGDKAIYSSGTKPNYGEIVQLDNTKGTASFKYYDEYGDEKIKNLDYTKLSALSKEKYDEFIAQQNIELAKHKFTNGEKVSWTDGKNPLYGEVVSLNTKSHDATVKSLNKYGEDKNATVDFLKVDKLDDTRFEELRKKELEVIKKHQFETGQKVSFVKDKKSRCGEVVNINNKSHTATIKYLGIYAEDKTSEEEYFDVEKISDEKYEEETNKQKKDALQYKFDVGEKVVWKKGSLLGMKSEAINAEIVSLNELEHKATVKYTNKDNVEKQETASYLDLSKVK